MSLVETWHQEHKDRVARLNGKKTAVTIVEPESESITSLKKLVADLASQIDMISRQVEAHESFIAHQLAQEDEGKPRMSEIIDSVCSYYTVRQIDVVGSRRTGDIMLPRQISFYLCRRLTGLSFPQIGRRIGGRDHTTAMHSYNKIVQALDTDTLLMADVDAIIAMVGKLVMKRTGVRYEADADMPGHSKLEIASSTEAATRGRSADQGREGPHQAQV